MDNSPTPSVLTWNPEKTPTASITTVVDAAYKTAQVVATLTLYDLDGSQLTSFYETANNVCGAAGPATFKMDVSACLANLPAGVYFYRVHAYSVGLQDIKRSGEDADDDKTLDPYLQIGKLNVKPAADDGTVATYDVTYALTGHVRAESAWLEFYDMDGKLQWTQPVDAHADTGVVFDHHYYGSGQTVSIQLPSGINGSLILQARDIRNRMDKNQGKKSPLQAGKPIVYSYCIGFFHDDYAKAGYDEPEFFKSALQHFSDTAAAYHAIPDKDLPGPSWYYKGNDVLVKRMIAALRHARTGSDQARAAALKVVVFGGHSSDTGGMIQLNGTNHQDLEHTTLLLPTAAYHNNPTKKTYFTLDAQSFETPGSGYVIKPFNALELDPMLNPSPLGPQLVLSELDLAILVGCTVGMPGKSALADEFEYLGAKCVLRVGDTRSALPCEILFFRKFFQYIKRPDMTIQVAVTLAKEKTQRDINEIRQDSSKIPTGQSDYWPFTLAVEVQGNGKDKPLKP